MWQCFLWHHYHTRPEGQTNTVLVLVSYGSCILAQIHERSSKLERTVFLYLWVPCLKSILNWGALRFAAATKHANRDPQVTRTGSCMLDMLQIDSPAELILHARN